MIPGISAPMHDAERFRIWIFGMISIQKDLISIYMRPTRHIMLCWAFQVPECTLWMHGVTMLFMLLLFCFEPCGLCTVGVSGSRKDVAPFDLSCGCVNRCSLNCIPVYCKYKYCEKPKKKSEGFNSWDIQSTHTSTDITTITNKPTGLSVHL